MAVVESERWAGVNALGRGLSSKLCLNAWVVLAGDVFAAAANALGVGVVEHVNEWLA